VGPLRLQQAASPLVPLPQHLRLRPDRSISVAPLHQRPQALVLPQHLREDLRSILVAGLLRPPQQALLVSRQLVRLLPRLAHFSERLLLLPLSVLLLPRLAHCLERLLLLPLSVLLRPASVLLLLLDNSVLLCMDNLAIRERDWRRNSKSWMRK
jgi:hypothetical protein